LAQVGTPVREKETSLPAKVISGDTLNTRPDPNSKRVESGIGGLGVGVGTGVAVGAGVGVAVGWGVTVGGIGSRVAVGESVAGFVGAAVGAGLVSTKVEAVVVAVAATGAVAAVSSTPV